jgi:hypothetical protein
MITIYKCEFCYRTYTDINNCDTHECECVYNPANRYCCTCKNHFYKNTRTTYKCSAYKILNEEEPNRECWEAV